MSRWPVSLSNSPKSRVCLEALTERRRVAIGAYRPILGSIPCQRRRILSLCRRAIIVATTSEKTPNILRHKDNILRSEEHTSELQSRGHLVCRLLLEKKKNKKNTIL